MLNAIELKHVKKNIPDLKAGDTVRVHQKIKEGAKERIQIFEGVVMAVKHGNGLEGSFTVRKIAVGVGVEKTFPIHMPSIVKIERVKSANIRRSKIYFLRDLRGRAARLKGEKADKAVWEEKGAEKEIEAIKEEQAEAAEIKAEEEAETLTDESESRAENVGKITTENEQETKQESGSDRGESSAEPAEK